MITICSGVSEDKIVDNEIDVTRRGESRETYCSESETLSTPR